MQGGDNAMKDCMKLYFIGARTTGSSVFRIFPQWAETLGVDAEVAPLDIPIDSDPSAYSTAIRSIRDDPAGVGALITTHKVRFFLHARAEFDELEPLAQLCGEISVVVHREGELAGKSIGDVMVKALDRIVPAGAWSSTGAHVLCFGAGGAGTALALALGDRSERPERVVLAETSDQRVDWLRSNLEGRLNIDLVHVKDSEANRSLLDDLPPRSVVVNATGLGKDRPGSPLPADAVFPQGATVWDLNYRGDLLFLDRAALQRDARALTIEDGWRLFLHSWADSMAMIFGSDLDAHTFARLVEDAQPFRPERP
jgi:shikimate 5-dehydrogenase